MYTYIYIYIYIHTYTHVYIYIYISHESHRRISRSWLAKFPTFRTRLFSLGPGGQVSYILINDRSQLVLMVITT